MKLDIVAIKFRHDADGIGNKALRIKKNAFEKIKVPKWQQGINTHRDDSPAAYAISQVGSHQICCDHKPPSASGSQQITVYSITSSQQAVIQGIMLEVDS